MSFESVEVSGESKLSVLSEDQHIALDRVLNIAGPPIETVEEWCNDNPAFLDEISKVMTSEASDKEKAEKIDEVLDRFMDADIAS